MEYILSKRSLNVLIVSTTRWYRGIRGIEVPTTAEPRYFFFTAPVYRVPGRTPPLEKSKSIFGIFWVRKNATISVFLSNQNPF